MRIFVDAIIAPEKLTRYLFVERPWDDKAGFLARGGFTQANPWALERAIREMAATVDAVEDGASEYGVFYRTEGELAGPVGQLAVVAIWMLRHSDGRIHFVTLKPRREKRA